MKRIAILFVLVFAISCATLSQSGDQKQRADSTTVDSASVALVIQKIDKKITDINNDNAQLEQKFTANQYALYILSQLRADVDSLRTTKKGR